MHFSCDCSHKNTILKSIHNQTSGMMCRYRLVIAHTKIQFWNQFTTSININPVLHYLWLLTQKYNFEINSQREDGYQKLRGTCDCSHKNTILKSIHNISESVPSLIWLVIAHTKIQFWNQFTTQPLGFCDAPLLWLLTQKYNFEINSQQKHLCIILIVSCDCSHKNTILKSIHNYETKSSLEDILVIAHTKIQFWNQFTT